MTAWVIVVDKLRDFNGNGSGPKVVTTRDYIAKPQNFRPGTKVINLARTYSYLGVGYYCSLLAEARSHRVIPKVDTLLELGQKSLYSLALPDLEEDLNRRVRRLAQPPEGPFKLLIAFGHSDDNRFKAFARRVFDWFRSPLLEVKIRFAERLKIASIAVLTIEDLAPEQEPFFQSSLDQYTRRSWQEPKAKVAAKYSLAVLHNPKETMPCSSVRTLQRFAKVAEGMGVEVELIEKKDFLKLSEYDALFIRETTAIDNHTYRFAKRAELEGLPVIDDTNSILRCTNKVYLAELLAAHRIATPKTLVVDGVKSLDRVEAEIPYPIVLKIPDGSFSRGVFKAKDRKELGQMAEALLEDSDLILAQEFMYTDYDWRVGVLDGEPLFACQYLMAKKHWQILKHQAGGKAQEGAFRTFGVEDAPADVIATAVRATRLIGNGLYGVDLKQNDRGVHVIEINDNPNLENGVEDAVLKDELWRRILRWFVKRLEQ